jgi:hypothetical protein
MEAGRPTAGSSRAGEHRASTIAAPWRLDPFSLPVRFADADEAADGSLRVVDLHRERVVLRRARAGMRMALNLPVAAYRGVAIKMFAEADKPPHMFAVTLEHADPALSLPLFRTAEVGDVVVEWQSWGKVLGLPLLFAKDDGALGEVFARIGKLLIAPPASRRRRRSAIARRRPRYFLRRRTAALSAVPVVHRGEREIIARD